MGVRASFSPSRCLQLSVQSVDSLPRLAAEVSACRRCPRLVAWREQVAAEKRAAFRDEDYWGRGIPGFGDPQAKLLVLGLAPAAHGGNRTGRVFTGDRSGDWLYRAMHRAGFANQPTSISRRRRPVVDGRLGDRRGQVCAARQQAVAGGAQQLQRLPAARDGAADRRAGGRVPRRVRLPGRVRRVRRETSSEVRPRCRGRQLAGGLHLLCSFHPSQQNTFTGRLTEAMLDDVFSRAVVLSG